MTKRKQSFREIKWHFNESMRMISIGHHGRDVMRGEGSHSYVEHIPCGCGNCPKPKPYPEEMRLEDDEIQRKKDAEIHVGDYVKLIDSSGEHKPEYGVVVQQFPDEFNSLDNKDNYVCFFGEELPNPNERPTKKPYVLRYYSSSLKKVKLP